MNTGLTQVQVCNQALAAIGVSKWIVTITEGSQQANACELFWDSVVDQVLQEYPWNFALTPATLVEATSFTVPGWSFTYVMPSDCVQALLIWPYDAEDTSGSPVVVMPPGYVANYYPEGDFYMSFLSLYKSRRRIPFKVFYNGVDSPPWLAICTNKENAVLVYTARITTISLWSPAFVNAVTWLLAAKIVTPLAAQPSFAQTAMQMYQAALLDAAALSFNEEVERPEPDSESILARY